MTSLTTFVTRSAPASSSSRPVLMVPFVVEGVLFRVSANVLLKDAESKLLDWASQYAEWMQQLPATTMSPAAEEEETMMVDRGGDRCESADTQAAWALFARRAAGLRRRMRRTSSSVAEMQLVPLSRFGNGGSHVAAAAGGGRAQQKRARGGTHDAPERTTDAAASLPLGSATASTVLGTNTATSADSSGKTDLAIFVDRNAELFGLLVRLLQGYRHCIPSSRMSECCEEARWYGLHRTWTARFPPLPDYQFYGGGHTVAGDRFTSYVVVSRLSPFFSRRTPRRIFEQQQRFVTDDGQDGNAISPSEAANTFTIRVQVELSDAVAIGVVSPLVTDYGIDCRGIEGTAWYSNGGDIACCPFAAPRLEKRRPATTTASLLPEPSGDDEGLRQGPALSPPVVLSPTTPPPCTHSKAPSYGTHSILTVSMDLQRGLVWWERNQDVVATVKMWPGSLARDDVDDEDDGVGGGEANKEHHQLAFAVQLSGKSSVRLLGSSSPSPTAAGTRTPPPPTLVLHSATVPD